MEMELQRVNAESRVIGAGSERFSVDFKADLSHEEYIKLLKLSPEAKVRVQVVLS